MKVLIVDDSPIFLNFFKKTLEKVSEIKLIQFAQNGRQALTILENGQYDLVILDLEMPLMDGYETLKKIKEKQIPAKVIICSGRTRVDFNAIQKAIHVGADGITSKSFQTGISNELSVEAFRNELIPRILKLYHHNRREPFESTIKNAYGKDIIDGVLVIHLLKDHKHSMTYDYGTLDEGILQVKNVLNVACATQTPIFLDETFRHLESFDEIYEGIKGLRPGQLATMKRGKMDQVSLDWVHKSMRDFIQHNKIGNLLVLGFNRTFCVENASEQINKYYDTNIVICDRLLFGNVAEQNQPTDKKADTLKKFRKRVYHHGIN